MCCIYTYLAWILSEIGKQENIWEPCILMVKAMSFMVNFFLHQPREYYLIRIGSTAHLPFARPYLLGPRDWFKRVDTSVLFSKVLKCDAIPLRAQLNYMWVPQIHTPEILGHVFFSECFFGLSRYIQINWSCLFCSQLSTRFS